MNKCAQSWARVSLSSSGVDSQLVGIKLIYTGRGAETFFSQEQENEFYSLFCGTLAFNPFFILFINVSSSSLSPCDTRGIL